MRSPSLFLSVPLVLAAFASGGALGARRARARTERAVVPVAASLAATSEPVQGLATTPHPPSDPPAGQPSSAVAVAPGGDSADYTAEAEDPTEPPASASDDLEALLAIVPLSPRNDETVAKARKALALRRLHVNQGNPKIARHRVSRAQCLDGLRGVVLQTARQRELCGGAWEVPLHTGDPEHAKACIDVFEYPNRPCTLPVAFVNPIQSSQLCALAGKRLCTQEEWTTACEAGEHGEPARKYAYGDELDLGVCATGKPWPDPAGPICNVDRDVWGTCGTMTEPAGSFPRCRSRLGVFDLHGNVAETMTRFDPKDRVTYVQFKGSAFFYDGKMYADTCRFDPRWHVDPVQQSWHANYHLGFRCCRDRK